MAYDFPASPTPGQSYFPAAGGPSYAWDGTAWRMTSGGVNSGVFIGDTPPPNPVHGQLWWESDTGNTFIYYQDANSGQWVQFNVASDPEIDRLVSLSADASWRFRTTGSVPNHLNRLAFNDKADGSGKDVVFIDETGQINSQVGGFMSNITFNGGSYHAVEAGYGCFLSLNKIDGALRYYGHPTAAAAGGAAPIAPVFTVDKDGNVNANGSIYAVGHITGDGFFLGNTGTVNVVISPDAGNTNGTIYLRPNGGNNVAGQAWISAAGDLTVGNFVVANNGHFISPAAYLVMACSGSGTVFLRPNGISSSVGEFKVSPDGSASLGAGVFGAANGYRCRTGFNGAYDGYYFNIHWNGSGLHGYVDATYLGQFTFASDYRIKKDVEDLPSTWEQVKALRPIRYTQADFTPPEQESLQREAMLKEGEDGVVIAPDPMFVADDIERWGFVAHELQETLIDSAATGEKDMEDGVQSPNPWTMLAAVTKALQEAMARIEALEAAR